MRKDEKTKEDRIINLIFGFLMDQFMGVQNFYLNIKVRQGRYSYPIKCSKISSWDIDTPFDLAIAECMLLSLKNKENL